MKRDLFEDTRRVKIVVNFLLAIALIVSSSIYLTNVNSLTKPAHGQIINVECVPNLLATVQNSTNCANLRQWKLFAIVGLARGCLFFVQIIAAIFAFVCLAGGDPHRRISNSAKLGWINFIVSLVLTIIPIYLAVNLSETNAIHSTNENLSGPALAIFVISLLELVSFCLICLWLLPVLLGTVIGACALFLCCLFCGRNVRETKKEFRDKMECVNLSNGVQNLAGDVKVMQI